MTATVRTTGPRDLRRHLWDEGPYRTSAFAKAGDHNAHSGRRAHPPSPCPVLWARLRVGTLCGGRDCSTAVLHLWMRDVSDISACRSTPLHGHLTAGGVANSAPLRRSGSGMSASTPIRLKVRPATRSAPPGTRQARPRPLIPTDAIAIAPATCNMVNKWAAGISEPSCRASCARRTASASRGCPAVPELGSGRPPRVSPESGATPRDGRPDHVVRAAQAQGRLGGRPLQAAEAVLAIRGFLRRPSWAGSSGPSRCRRRRRRRGPTAGPWCWSGMCRAGRGPGSGTPRPVP